MIRRYELRSPAGSRAVKALVQMDYASGFGKSIQILQERSSSEIFRRALHKVFDAEIHGSIKNGREETRVSPENYSFRLAGTELHDGRHCYVLELTPKHRTRYLLDGRAWVDTGDFGLVALEGHPATSLSFWVGKPYILQSYEKVGDFWLLTRTRSVADARIIGRIDLTVETETVEMGGTTIALVQPRDYATGIN